MLLNGHPNAVGKNCAWESLKLFLQEAVPEQNSIAGNVIGIQTFGDLFNICTHKG